MTLGIDWTTDWIRRSAAVIAEHRGELVTLDREIGDGDHGENLDRGFTAVRAKLDDLPGDSTPGDALKMVATTLISTVGGASGPLLGTAYLKAAGAVGQQEELPAQPAILGHLRVRHQGLQPTQHAVGTGGFEHGGDAVERLVHKWRSPTVSSNAE